VTWPKLPKQIGGHAGSIDVLRPVRIKEQQEDHLGRDTAADWDDWRRQIRVTATAPRRTALHLFLHELVHAALDDGGIALKDEDQEELVCQSVASSMMHVVEWLMTHRTE
jgi:hypothetical protein